MSGFWRKCRVVFRCLRFTVWGSLLLLLAGFAWINLVGLPDFLKNRLVTALHQRGVDLEFSRMRLRYYGLVCEDVRIGAANDAASPVLTAREVRLRVDYGVLLHRRLQVDGLVLHQGKFTLPLTPPDTLVFTNLQGELRILPDDTWSLDHFRVDLAGATFTLAGAIAHAPECRNWKLFASTATPGRGSVQTSLKRFHDLLKQIHFEGKPKLNARIDGDARDAHSFAISISATAPAVETPWCSLRQLEFATHLRAPTNTPPLHGGPAWDSWTNLEPFRLDWFVRGTNFTSPRVAADALDCTGTWGEARDVPVVALTVNARAQGVQTSWGSVRRVDFATRVFPATNAPAGDPAWGFWTNLQPWQANWLARVSDVKSPALVVDNLACSGSWNAPELTVSELSARLGEGRLETSAGLNVATRHLGFSARSRFDLHALAALLPGQTREKLAQITWGEAPRLAAGGWLVLPPWGQPAPNWQNDLLAGAVLHGDAAVTNLTAAGVALNSAQVQFAVSNQVWNLSRLCLLQGRTRLNFSGEDNELTKDFHGRVDGQLDEQSIRPFLDTNALHALNKYLTFREPVHFTLDAAGNLRDFATLSVTGRVALTNFAIRGQGVDSLAATLDYSNLTAEFYHPQMFRAGGSEQFAADRMTLDIPGEKLLIHAGKGHVLPMAVARAIGPLTAAAMEPYQFLAIPDALVEGCIPLKHRADGELDTAAADLRFDVLTPAPFRWRRFETPRIAGTIRWLAHDVILTNVISECYDGTAYGWGIFDVETPGAGTDFSFFVGGTNVDFNAMGRQLWSPTNQLRGALSGNVLITHANSDDWRTWNGYGELQLQKGLLWDAPALGLLSRVLNTLMPGLDMGNSRATDATGRFTMTNGVIHTDNLEIRSLTMLIYYVGTVDLRENISARAQAQLLRNTPLVGPLFSAVLTPVTKACECQVTGTLDEPHITPLYLPFSQVLHPIRTVEKIFTSTNSPAKPSP